MRETHNQQTRDLEASKFRVAGYNLDDVERLAEAVRYAANFMDGGADDADTAEVRQAAAFLEQIASVLDVTLGQVLSFGHVVTILRKGAPTQ